MVLMTQAAPVVSFGLGIVFPVTTLLVAWKDGTNAPVYDHLAVVFSILIFVCQVVDMVLSAYDPSARGVFLATILTGCISYISSTFFPSFHLQAMHVIKTIY